MFIKIPIIGKLFHRIIPRGLFGRTLLIIVAPTLLALCAATFVFFDRHWETVTTRMAQNLAGDIAVVVEMMHSTPAPYLRGDIVRLADKKMSLYVSYSPGARLPRPLVRPRGPLSNIVVDALDEQLAWPYSLSMRHAPKILAIQVEVPEGVYTVLFPERRIYTPTTAVFIAWMVGSSILLSAIALLFMRNQVRPIRRLAEAAEAMGKGLDVPWFRPAGATEVRQAANALLIMRDRLKRQMTQRTTMLAGISHDLRTPLTRMKLQLAMMDETPEKNELLADATEMENMVNAYLAFARGEESEPAVPTDIVHLITEVVSVAQRQNPAIVWDRSILAEQDGTMLVTVRRMAIKRCLGNLIGNALRYGKQAFVSVTTDGKSMYIIIDDDGTGIATDKREEVFRPFLRLDESRNSNTGGVGLGLTIARDIARSHGGDIELTDSPQGGLRAMIRLPV